MKVLKSGAERADTPKEMGAPAVTTTPFRLSDGRDSTRMRRTRIWLSVVGSVLTLVGALTVIVLRDSPPASVVVSDLPGAAPGAGPAAGPATTVVGAPAANRQPGTIAPGPSQVTPGSPTAPPPATPQEVAELLAGLPLQLQQAADASGQPRELTPAEVDRMVDDILRQLGVRP